MDDSIKASHQQLFSQADALLEEKLTDSKPVIAAWGLMNAGKSYLLNMLTGHFETERFRTNDIRETAQLQAYTSDDFVFLDTPGLDANDADNQQAQQGAKRADVILFVHQPPGELEKIEVDFLRELVASFGSYADQNIILILSKSDAESAEKIDAIEKRILEQCRSDLNFSPRCFTLSGTRFKTGMTQNKQGLVRASHIQELEHYLQRFAGVSAVQRERQLVAVNELIAGMKRAEAEVAQIKSDTKAQLIDGFAAFNLAVKAFRQTMDSHAAALRNIR